MLISLASFAQTKDVKKINKGDKLFGNRAYFKSMEIYEKVANDGYKSVELFEKLGDSYFFNGEYAKANIWYNKLFEFSKEVDPIYYYRYSQTLKSVDDNKNADFYLQQFAALNQNDSRSEFYTQNKDYLSDIKDYSGRYVINDAGINTEFSDFGPTVFNDKVVFSSSRMPVKNVKKDDWSSDYYYSLYTASFGKDNTLVDAEPFAKEIQTEYHESDPVFTKDGKTMFFTRSVVDKNKKKSQRSVLLKIYKASLINNKWSNITALGFNSDSYNCAHPALSPDDKVLYFVSDMPGGFGDTDLYKIPVSNEMIQSQAVNLGSNVNTSGKETFPWISTDNELYFSSDGHLGLGGLDLFVTKIDNSIYTSKVINLGKPVNSQFDDFGFIKIDGTQSGFFSSNRAGGRGKDDIYGFTENIIISKIKGLVIDDVSKDAISGAVINIYDINHNLLSTLYSDDMGKFSIDINDIHYIKVEKPSYETKEVVLNLIKGDLGKEIVIGLTKSSVENITSGTDLAKLLNIKDIRFDLDKFAITSDAEVELQKVFQVLKQFPDMKITINSYTDSRQSDKYNMILSNKRANSTRAYLISKGISGNRITAKGYGETRLLNGCSNGVDCTEEEHHVNRRSEFIIDK